MTSDCQFLCINSMAYISIITEISSSRSSMLLLVNPGKADRPFNGLDELLPQLVV